MMGRRGKSSMAASGLLLALLLAMAVVSTMSLRMDPERAEMERREREIEERRRGETEKSLEEEMKREMERIRELEERERQREQRERERERRERREADDEDNGRREYMKERERERRRERREREEGRPEYEEPYYPRRRRHDEDREHHHHRRHESGSRRFEGELQLKEPREYLRTEGGSLRVWEQIRAMEGAEVMVNAARITLHERGMVLPKYADAATLAYVEEGNGMVGLLTGFSLGENVRCVRRGDVIAIPKGFAQWWYNLGSTDLRIVAMADTTSGVFRGDYTPFPLVGGGGGGHHEKQQLRSILFGFDKDFLADAWDEDESEVSKVLGSQKGVGIIRAEQDVHREMEHVAAAAAANEQNKHISVLSEYAYNVFSGTPEIQVQNAGHLTACNRFKLPLLKAVKLGLTHGVLHKNALFAPHWSPTGHQVVHILRGSAHLQIASNEGQQLVNQKVTEGDVYVIPRFFPAGVRAGNEGLEWISFYTTDMPYVEALAGKTSVLKNLPDPVAAAAFNVDMDLVRQCKKRRLREAFLLPPRGQGGETHHDHANFEGSYLRFLHDV